MEADHNPEHGAEQAAAADPNHHHDEEGGGAHLRQDHHSLCSDTFKYGIGVSVLILLAVSWLVYFNFGEEINAYCLDFTKDYVVVLGPAKWLLYPFGSFWTSWKMFFPALVLYFTPSRTSAIKSIWTLILGSWTKTILLTSLKEVSPNITTVFRPWDSTSCECKYTMPSSVAENGFLLTFLTLHEILSYPKTYTRQFKFFTILGATIFYLAILNNLLIKGQKTLPQLILGVLWGAGIYSLSIMFARPFTTFVRAFLQRKRVAVITLLGISFGLVVVNTFLWFYYLSPSIANWSIVHVRCFKCFHRNNRQISQSTANSLGFSSMLFGIMLGLYLCRPIYLGKNKDMLKDNLSSKGFARAVILIFMHFPLLAPSILPYMLPSPAINYLGETVLNISSGYLITYVSIRLFSHFNLKMRGDLLPPWYKHLRRSEIAYLLQDDSSLILGYIHIEQGAHYPPSEGGSVNMGSFEWSKRSDSRDKPMIVINNTDNT